MRWLPLLSVFIGLSVDSGRLLSQEVSVEDSPGQTLSSLLRESDRARFDLVMGRLRLDQVRYRKGSVQQTARSPVDGEMIAESLAIESWRGHPRLHYTRRDGSTQTTLDVDQFGSLRLVSEQRAGAEKLTVSQPRAGPLVLRLRSGQQHQELRFSTWVHLYMAQPGLYHQHLEPLLDDLLHPVSLSQLAEQAHTDSLLRLVPPEFSDLQPWQVATRGADRNPPTQLDEPALAESISQLGSASRLERSLAQERLRQQGISVVPRLRAWEASDLDAEQRARIAELQRQLTPKDADCGSRLATLIERDPEYWVAAGSRLTATEKAVIAQRLNHPLDAFDGDLVRVAKPPQAEMTPRSTTR